MFRLTAFGRDQIGVLKNKVKRNPDSSFYKEMLSLLEEIDDTGMPYNPDWSIMSILVKRGVVEATD